MIATNVDAPRISIYLQAERKQKLCNIAHELDRSLSWVVQQLLDKYADQFVAKLQATAANEQA